MKFIRFNLFVKQRKGDSQMEKRDFRDFIYKYLSWFDDPSILLITSAIFFFIVIYYYNLW